MEPEASDLEGIERDFTDGGEGGGSTVPWGDRFLCDEDCGRGGAIR